MSEDQRQHPRQEVQIEVSLYFLEDKRRKVKTRNISEGGLFVHLNNASHYTMGELISLNFKSPFEDNDYINKDAIIVRHTDDGIAVAFIEIEGSQPAGFSD